MAAPRPASAVRPWYYVNRHALGERVGAGVAALHAYDVDLEGLELMRYGNAKEGVAKPYVHRATVAYRVRQGDALVARHGAMHPLGALLTFEGHTDEAAAHGTAMFWVMPQAVHHSHSGRTLLLARHFSFMLNGRAGGARTLGVHLTEYLPTERDPDKGSTRHTHANALPVGYSVPGTPAELAGKLGSRLADYAPEVWGLMHRPFEGERGTIGPRDAVTLVQHAPASPSPAAAQAGGAARGRRGGRGRRAARRHEAARGARPRSFRDLWVELPLKRVEVVALRVPGAPRPTMAVTVFLTSRAAGLAHVLVPAAYGEVPAAEAATPAGLEAAVARLLAGLSWRDLVPRDLD